MYDVIIVGGGPVGVFVACELKLAGVEPLVLERLPEINQWDKAHGLTGQVVHLLDHRGLFKRCAGTPVPTAAPSFFFGALPLPLHVLGVRNPMYLLHINQRDLERALGERAAELGVEIRVLAEAEGMITDPVYEGKSMAGLIGMIRSGEIPPGSTLLYCHLGGQPALSAYAGAPGLG